MLPFDVWRSAFFGEFEVRFRKKNDFVFVASVVYIKSVCWVQLKC